MPVGCWCAVLRVVVCGCLLCDIVAAAADAAVVVVVVGVSGVVVDVVVVG